MRTLMKSFILVPILLLFVGCGGTETTETTREVSTGKESIEKESKMNGSEKKPCPYGNSYPFDKCGKDSRNPQPLEALPRILPNLAYRTPITDLRNIPNLTETLAGEWIGSFLDADSRDNVRIHWQFNTDYSFRASVFSNVRGENRVMQNFVAVSGTFSTQGGQLLLELSQREDMFSYSCHGFSWEVGKLLQLIVPVGIHEDGKTLTMHRNETHDTVISVLVKKES